MLSIKPSVSKAHRIFKNSLLNFYKYCMPKRYADVLFKRAFGYGINWEQPRDLNEWINYLAFKTNTSEWSRLADKYIVRDYVVSKGLSMLLIPLYGVWDNADHIDFNTLPDSFVIKTNHGCGNSILVEQKDLTNLELVREKMKGFLSVPYGRESAEPHYLRIKPLIMAEQLIPPPFNRDYKVWCFHGQPDCIMTISNRTIEDNTYDLNVYDLGWQKHNEWLVESYRNEVDEPKPECLEKMLQYSRVLSEGFPQVRIDFYSAFGKVFFGEMTFTSYAGRMDYFTKERLVAMGNKIKMGFHDNIH